MEHSKTVLIIDDEEDLRETVEYKFKAGGFKVVTAADGVEGLEKLKTVNPDLIILDMNMPRMNGLEFYEQIKGSDEKPKYPVLVLTARANMEQLFRDLDVDGFMAKPFELDELLKEGESIIKKNSGSVQEIEQGIAELRARQVCIIENDPAVFPALAIAFLERGYIVNSAHSGAAAIKRMSRDAPDLAIVSMGLKDISGDIVIGKLHHIEKTAKVKFILYSNVVADIDKTIITQRISQKEGVCRFVSSCDAQELLRAADELFAEMAT